MDQHPLAIQGDRHPHGPQRLTCMLHFAYGPTPAFV